MNLGKRIDRLRKNRHMSQQALCKGIISSAHLSNIKRGRYAPAEDILQLLAERLHVPLDYLLHHDQECPQVESKLQLLKQHLFLHNVVMSKQMLIHIEKAHPYITSVTQEFWFYTLSCLYELRHGTPEEALPFYEHHIDTLVDEEALTHLHHTVQESYYQLRATIAFYQAQYEESLYWSKKQRSVTIQPLAKADVLHNIGMAFLQLCQRNESRQALEKALHIYKQNGQSYKACKTLNVLFVLLWELEDYTLAEEKLHQAYYIALEHTYDQLLASIQYHFGLLYKTKGLSTLAKDCFAHASTQMEQSDSRDINHVLCSWMELLLEEERVEEATKILHKAEQHVHSEGDKHHLLVLKAKIHAINGENAKYIKLMNKSIHYFHEKKHWRQVEHFSRELAEHLYHERRYKMSADFFRRTVEAIQYQK
ncbi:helix-turn-helix domain-containing protein [Caldalkalibacillus salinus]|uniref:helix-turn-helix domain-containing protein n=1 Tax=Caldalkalibacillus salinus TaxID=2803787 RepID=UPI0019213485|nr:helix-turn-helix transcriptional regulator [Caldalkalibacillus salinus]